MNSGALLPLNAYNIAQFGFNSGFYLNALPIYPGSGEFSDCGSIGNTIYGPARITEFGAYLTCANNIEYYNPTTAKFFYNHGNLNWVPTDIATVGSVAGKVSLGTYQNTNLFVSRKSISSPSLGTFSQIGRIWNGYHDFWNGGQEVISSSDNFDVLVCDSSLKTKITHSVVDPNSYPCGTFVEYDIANARNAPETSGFAGGINYDSSNEFVGYGNGICGIPSEGSSPGFILTEPNKSGLYVSCSSGLRFFKGTSYYLLKNTYLTWENVLSVTPTSRSGLLLNSTVYPFLIGRFFYQGGYRLGKVHVGSKAVTGIYFTNENNKELFFDKNYEILKCVPQGKCF